jgi:aminocarboxymuconate-semialdehyde decarboxylase
MARAGIARQVLSPMPELLSYWLTPDDALALGRHVNDTIADMTARAPERFVALGMVPLQDPELAARELEALMESGAFRGVEIGTNVNGTPIGDPRFEPFFAAAEALGAAIFVHALHPIGLDRLVGPPVLGAVVAFPCETSFAIASLITGGTLVRHPRLRLAFSHGGGAFGLVLPRLMHGWKSLAPVTRLIERSPLEQARALYYDTLVYDAATLRFLIERFGMTQLCLGTDHPFDIQEKAPVAALSALDLAPGDRELLLFANAERFLGMG